MKSLRLNNPFVLTLTTSFFFAAAYNFPFWKRFVAFSGGFSLSNLPLFAAVFLVLVLLVNVLLTVVTFRPLIKPALILLFCITAMAAYFMAQYGAVIDSTMVQSVVETNPREVFELLNWRMAAFFIVLGVLPSAVLWRIPLRFPSWRKGWLLRVGAGSVSLLLAVALILAFFKHLAPTFRAHRELQFMLTPVNYLMATRSYLKRKLQKAPVVAPIGTDAMKGGLWQGSARRTVTVIVLGETARARNFSLNGYGRETNPKLASQSDLVNFSNVQACGTATAVSVPCLFSSLGREKYSEDKAKSQQGLMDVLSHAGFEVLWRNNNSGCKGVCDRVEYEDMSKPIVGNKFCGSDGCYDERLLEGLPARIRSSSKDMVIVLHQLGSHGPTYWKRYPESFKRFGPECETSDLQKCSSESIVATYDNTILYTDHFLSRTIDLLRQLESENDIDVSMIYFSDHGESLGENNMYLHGAPYLLSPIEQRHVPFMVWMPERFRQRFRIDGTCLAARADQPFSHDNIFHSVLGMLNIRTAVRNPALDMFESCSTASRPAS